MSTFDAREQIRLGLRELLDDGHTAAAWRRPALRNRVLDRCGSDHRPLLDLVLFASAKLPSLEGAPIAAGAWPTALAAVTAPLIAETFLEPDAARWAVETLYWVHRRIDDAQLAPARPFSSSALPALPSIPRTERAARTSAAPVRASTLQARGSALHGGVMATPALVSGPALQTLHRGATAGGLRFGQPWYAVANGNALIALPSPSRGPRRAPPIAPISSARLFTGWTRQTFAVAGVLGAATLTVAFSYWLMLNAARDGTARDIIARQIAGPAGPMILPPRDWQAPSANEMVIDTLGRRP